MAPNVVIGILTWRGYDATRTCLESLRSLSEWPISTVVVDSASGTGEATQLAREFGAPVEALELPRNGGVPAGYNAAIQWAAEHGAEHVLLLNNDTVIEDPAMLERLISATGDTVGAIGPIVHDPDGTIFSAGGFVSMWKGVADHWNGPPRTDKPYSAEWLDGPCLLISIAAARRIGGLEPTYFLYWEELDWCVRARRAGFECIVQPATSILHARSTREPSPQTRYLLLRNGILFMRRNGTIGQNLTSLTYLVLARIPKLLLRSMRRHDGLLTAVRTSGGALAWNLADAARHGWRRPADGPVIK